MPFGTRIKVRSGVEGPKHDPYGWCEVTVRRPDCTVSLRVPSLGYGILTIDGLRMESVKPSEDLILERLFCKLSGLDIGTAMDLIARREWEEADPMGRLSDYE